MTLRTFLITFASLLAMPSSFSAADRYVPFDAELQAALTVTQPGDTILLEPGLTYLGNFVTGQVRCDFHHDTHGETRSRAAPGGDADISFSGRPASAPAVAELPSGAQDRRRGPPLAASVSGVRPEQGRLRRSSSSEARANRSRRSPTPSSSFISISTATRSSARNGGLRSMPPAPSYRDSHISDCKAVGQDAQAIVGWNGPGPYWIENNYLEGAGDNFMLGGADPAIPGLIPTDVTFRRNYVSKPVSWRDPIVATPVGVTAGNLPGKYPPVGTYAYRIVARRPSGQGTTARSTASVQATAAVTSTGSAVQIQWSAVPGAAEYLVYGRTPGAQECAGAHPRHRSSTPARPAQRVLFRPRRGPFGL